MKTKNSFLLAISLIGLTATSLHAQVGINNTAANPDPSAILDLKSGNAGVNKGFLPQSVALTNVNSAAPVTSPATGLIVYSSTAPSGGYGPGYYYWNGTAWAGFAPPPTINGSGTNNYVARWTPNGSSLGSGMIQDNGSTVGVNSVPGLSMLSVNSTNAGAAVSANATNAAGDSVWAATYGVWAYTSDPGRNYAGVYGEDDGSYGVLGNSYNWVGVYGY
jgi:hypothetical protein